MTSLWTNLQAQVKNSPKIMGRICRIARLCSYIMAELVKTGHTSVVALGLFSPDIQKYAITMVTIGKSKGYTTDPSTELFKSFAKMVIGDIKKNNLLRK